MRTGSLIRAIAVLPLIAAAAAAPSPGPVVSTLTPYDRLQQCFRDRWAGSGRLTAINTAAGTILDFAFDSVAADGKVAQSHATFAIEDRGTERRVTASAANPADAALSTQMLAQTMATCAPDAAKR